VLDKAGLVSNLALLPRFMSGLVPPRPHSYPLEVIPPPPAGALAAGCEPRRHWLGLVHEHRAPRPNAENGAAGYSSRK